MNVLITAASTAQAYKLEKVLSETNNVVFADSAELPELLLKSRKFLKIATADSASYAHQLLSCCLSLDIQLVFPLRRQEIAALVESRQLFDEYGIKVMLPAMDTIEQYFGSAKTGELIIKGLNSDSSAQSPDRGAFLFNKGANPEFQILTVD